jgi:hypothetical protein
VIELVDTFPDINIEPAEYIRLLGYPRDHVLAGRARELSQAARAWYGKNGRPWVYARQIDSLQIGQNDKAITLDGFTFSSTKVLKMLKDAGAQSAFVVAVSAGPECEAQAQQLWKEEKPDEYFFMEIYGSAVVEHLTTMTGARLCSWADRNAMAVLPHYSPGYPEWDISQQPALMELLRQGARQPLPQMIEVMHTGMLRPKKSLLALFGLTSHVDRVQRLTSLVPCENCSYASCQYRRASYARGPSSISEIPVPMSVNATAPLAADLLDRNAQYQTNPRALQRWVDDRLKLTFHPDGTVSALFKYEGTTCSNTGRALYFDYTVKLGPRAEGYPLREMKCAPSQGDEGHTFMCRYMSNAEHLMVAIDHEKPLLGKQLNDLLTWQRPKSGAGCYCEPTSRQHKWSLVLETLHFALVQREKTVAS